MFSTGPFIWGKDKTLGSVSCCSNKNKRKGVGNDFSQ
jgi:hypothetical protein